MTHALFTMTILFLVGCSSIPEGIKPVANFDLEKYAGTWYEIARLDHRYERGLERVTATYSINDDGTVKVVNKGFSTNSEEWEDAQGKAKFAGNSDTGYLRVSFFGPFYGSYVIFELGTNYDYAIVTGSESSLWLLSRKPTIENSLRTKLLNTMDKYGYDKEEIIFVKH